jgi:hypothetical protein
VLYFVCSTCTGYVIYWQHLESFFDKQFINQKYYGAVSHELRAEILFIKAEKNFLCDTFYKSSNVLNLNVNYHIYSICDTSADTLGLNPILDLLHVPGVLGYYWTVVLLVLVIGWSCLALIQAYAYNWNTLGILMNEYSIVRLNRNIENRGSTRAISH